jgi:AcrR family transcriptional regulator
MERRDQILDAAVRCFARTGFHATGIADVIAEAGMSAGGVYRYFDGKEALIHGVVERLLERLQGALGAAGDAAPSLATFVDGALDVVAVIFDEPGNHDARLLPNVWTEALRDPTIQLVVRRSYVAVIDLLARSASALQTRGALPAGMTPRGAAHLVLATLQGFMLQRLLLGPEFDERGFRAAARAALGGG